jgi:ribose 5-phosphate isomerase B
MTVFFASDHAGFELKSSLMEYVSSDLGHEVKDCGPFAYDAGDDYPDFVRSAAANLLEAGPEARAIVLGMSGQGEAIAANRFAGVRAAVYYGGPTELISLSREHNDANILSLGAGFIDEGEAKAAVKLWLETDFSNEERHIRRNAKLDEGT